MARGPTLSACQKLVTYNLLNARTSHRRCRRNKSTRTPKPERTDRQIHVLKEYIQEWTRKQFRITPQDNWREEMWSTPYVLYCIMIVDYNVRIIYNSACCCGHNVSRQIHFTSLTVFLFAAFARKGHQNCHSCVSGKFYFVYEWNAFNACNAIDVERTDNNFWFFPLFDKKSTFAPFHVSKHMRSVIYCVFAQLLPEMFEICGVVIRGSVQLRTAIESGQNENRIPFKWVSRR